MLHPYCFMTCFKSSAHEWIWMSWCTNHDGTWMGMQPVPDVYKKSRQSVQYDHWSVWLCPMVSGLVLVPVRQLCPAVERRQHRSGPSLLHCSCRCQAAELVTVLQRFISVYCFRISHHVLPAGPPGECLLLLHCVPLHPPLPQPRLHLRHLRLPVIQLHPEGRLQGRRPEPQWLSLLAPLTAKIAHYELSEPINSTKLFHLIPFTVLRCKQEKVKIKPDSVENYVTQSIQHVSALVFRRDCSLSTS